MPNRRILEELSHRLPELQWALRAAGKQVLRQALPQGMFRTSLEAEPQVFIDEILSDMGVLSRCIGEASGHALAQKIRHKIDLLVAACRGGSAVTGKNSSKTAQAFQSAMVTQMTTRRQWVVQLEEELGHLNAEHAALAARLAESKEPSLQLGLQAQLGKLRQQLTLLQEAYAQASGGSGGHAAASSSLG